MWTANPPGVTGECVCVLGRWGIEEEVEREKRNESEREREREPEASLYSTYSQCIARKQSNVLIVSVFSVERFSHTESALIF